MAVRVATAARTLGSVWLGDLSTEVAPEAIGAQTRASGGLEAEGGERLLALSEVAVVYEQQDGNAASQPSCHSRMQDESGNRCFFRRHVQSLLEVLRT